MKRSLKNTVAGYAVALSLAALPLACADKKTTTTESSDTSAATSDVAVSNASEGDAAYTDFKNYVSNLDTTALASMDTASGNWNQQRVLYDEKIARLDQHAANYDETRRQELAQLKARYGSYWNSRASARSGGSAPAPAAVEATGEKVETDVSKAAADVKQTGQKAGDKISEGAEKVGQAAKNTTKDVAEAGEKVGSKVGQAAKNTTQDVAEAGEKVGSKVGQAAKETGKDVKKVVVKGAKAVGEGADKAGTAIKNTTKKAGDKVEDVLDGDKKKE